MHGLICFTSILISLVFCDTIPGHMFRQLFTSPWLFLAGAFSALLPGPISSRCSFWFPLRAGGFVFGGGLGAVFGEGGLMCGGVQIIVLMVWGSSIWCVRKVFRGVRPSTFRQLVIIAHQFTCGEKKNRKNIKKSQNTMKMIVRKIFFWFLCLY